MSELKSLPFFEWPTELFLARGVSREMRLTLLFSISVLSATLGCALAVAQEYVAQSGPPPVRAANPDADPVPLEWVPPALAQLSLLAPIKSNFTLDRTMLGIAAGLVPDTDAPTRQAMHKLDGVSVHTMRFNVFLCSTSVTPASCIQTLSSVWSHCKCMSPPKVH